jgi:hypothetical protein
LRACSGWPRSPRRPRKRSHNTKGGNDGSQHRLVPALTGRLDALEARTEWLAGQHQKAERARFNTDTEVVKLIVEMYDGPGLAKVRESTIRSVVRHLRPVARLQERVGEDRAGDDDAWRQRGGR